MSFHPPLIYDSEQHKPIEAGDHITPAALPISATPGNIITVEADGLSVLSASAISAEPDNSVTLGSDNRLFVAAPPDPKPQGFISGDTGNDLTLGDDAKLFVHNPRPADFLSNQAENSLGISSIDNKIYFRKDEPYQWISTDAGNSLKLGVDANLYVAATGGITNPAELVSTDIRNKLTLGSDLLLYVPSTVVDGQVEPADLISTDTGNSIKQGSDGLLFTRVPAIATDAQLTLENTTMTPSAAQLTGVYNRVTALEAGGGSGTVDLSSVVPITRTISTTAPLTGGGDLSANRTLAISSASTSARGAVQLATTTEATTGTDTAKAVTSAGLAAHVTSKISTLATAESVAAIDSSVDALVTRMAALEAVAGFDPTGLVTRAEFDSAIGDINMALGDISTALAAIIGGTV